MIVELQGESLGAIASLLSRGSSRRGTVSLRRARCWPRSFKERRSGRAESGQRGGAICQGEEEERKKKKAGEQNKIFEFYFAASTIQSLFTFPPFFFAPKLLPVVQSSTFQPTPSSLFQICPAASSPASSARSLSARTRPWLPLVRRREERRKSERAREGREATRAPKNKTKKRGPAEGEAKELLCPLTPFLSLFSLSLLAHRPLLHGKEQ